MSSAITFDTLKFVETLKASGFDDTQARGMANALRDVQAAQTEEVVAKKDLQTLESHVATKADMAKVEMQVIELKRDIKGLEVKIEAAKGETIKWTAGIFAAQTAIIIGAMFAMAKMNLPNPPAMIYQPPAQEMRLPTPVQPTPQR